MDIRKIAMKLASILPWKNSESNTYFDNGFMQVNGKTSKSKMTGFEREYITIHCPDLVHIAARELSEETGYVSDSWEFLGELYVQPAVHSNKVYMFLARNIILTAGKTPDKGEELEVLKIKAGEVINMCKNGGIMHPFSQSLILQLVEIL